IAIILLIPVIIILMKKQNTIKEELLGVITKSLQSSKVPKINVNDAVQNEASYIFLDSREKTEYQVSHIKNSIFVGDADFNLNKIRRIPKDANIIVYCSVGIRSDKIAKEIIDAGYIHVHNLFGGIFEWINKGNPVFNSNENQTDSVHGYSKFWGTFVRSDHKVYK
ncbi:MAG: rhodanese-like domain-containing protein, partial [Bacteroidota bacterium]|nr:rhodanese-like domain-containing protein [Bacteroidota bacterium]